MFTGITFLIIVSVLLSITGGTAVAYGAPVLHDEHLVLEVFTSEFGWGYTAMAFVGDDTSLISRNMWAQHLCFWKRVALSGWLMTAS